jgi:hypothetical protein
MKITKEHVESLIADGKFMRVPESNTTLCALYTQCGFVVTGESACIDAADFDVEVGQRLAYEMAFQKLWDFEAYYVKRKSGGDLIKTATEKSSIITP